MTTSIGELQIAIRFDTKSLDSSVNKSGSIIQKFGETAQTALVTSVVQKGFDVAINAAKDFAVSIVETGKQFDTAMSQVAATMGKTTDEIADLRDFAKEMGTTTKFTATEAAEGLNVLAMAGLKADEQIAALPTVLDLASAGSLSLEAAATYAMGAVKGFGDSAENTAYYADLMAKGATLAATDVAGLGTAFSASAATAASYGQTAEDLEVALLRLAEANVTGEAASTALNRAMADLYTPTDEAKAALTALGVSVYDTSGQGRDFNAVVDDLSTALSEMTDEQANAYAATIFTQQGLQALNKMTAVSVEKVNEFASGLQDAAGSAAQQASTQIDNLEGDLTLLNSAVDGVKVQLYESFEPALRAAAQGAVGLTDAVGWVIDHGGEIISALAAITAGYVAYQLAVNGATIAQGIATTATNVMATAQAALNLVMSLNPIGLIIAAIAALVVGLIALWNNCEGFRKFVTGFFDQLGKFFAWVGEKLGEFGDFAMEVFDNISSFVGEVFNNIASFISSIIDHIVSFFTGMWNTVLGIFTGIGEFLYNIFSIPIAIIQTLIEAVLKIGEIIGTVIYVTVASAVNFFISIFQSAWDFLSSGIMAVGEWFSGLWEGLMEGLTIIGEFFSSIFEGVWTAISGVVDNIKNAFQGAWDFVTSIFGKVGQWFKDRFNEAYNGIKSIFDNIVSFFQGIWDKTVEIFTGIAEGIGNAVKNAISGAINFVIGAIEGFINGVINAINGLIDGVNSVSEVVGVHIDHLSTISLGRVEFTKGGIVPGTSYYGDRVPALVNSGEMVITRAQQAALWNAIDSGELGGGAPAPNNSLDSIERILANAFGDEYEGTVTTDDRPLTVYMENNIDNSLDIDQVGNELLAQIRRVA